MSSKLFKQRQQRRLKMFHQESKQAANERFCVSDSGFGLPLRHSMCGHESGGTGACAIAVGTGTTLNSNYRDWLKPCFIYQHPT